MIVKKADQSAVERAYWRFLYEIESIRKNDDRLPGVSIGYTFADREFGDISAAVLEADQNMYRFKRQLK